MPQRAERDLTFNLHERRDNPTALTQAANDLDRLSRGMDASGDRARQFTNDQHKLNDEIRKTTDHIRDLERQMIASGDRTMRRAIASERSWLREMQRISAAMPGAPDTRGRFRRFGSNVGDMFSSQDDKLNEVIMMLPRQMSGAAILGGLIGGAALGPLLGAGIAGLLAGGLGTVGVGGAAAMSLRSGKVQDQGPAFGQSIANEFFRGSAIFEKPVLQSMTILAEAFKDLKLPEAFAKMAPHITTIADAFGEMAKNIMPGLNRAFDRMGVFTEAAHEGLSELGRSLGMFLDEITASPGAVMGLDAMFKIIGGTIVFLGKNLRFLADAFAGVILLGEKTSGFFEDIPVIGKIAAVWNDVFEDTAHGLDGAADKVDEFDQSLAPLGRTFVDVGAAIADTNRELMTFADQISGMLNDQMAFDEAQIAVEQGWLDLAAAINENGTALGLNTEAGLRNRQAILDQIENLARLRDAEIKVTGTTSDATQSYNDSIAALIDLGVKAGLSREALEKLAGNYFVTVAFQSDMTRWLREFGSLIPGQGVSTFATGGTVPGPVGSPRLAIVHGGERVLTPGQQMNGGASTAVDVGFFGDLDQAFATLVMRMFRNGQITVSSRAIAN